MVLRNEQLLIEPVPAARPVFIGPAEAERQIELGVLKVLPDGRFHQPLAAKPVKVEAKAAQSRSLREFHLAALHVRNAQVVKAQFTRQRGLVVDRKSTRLN